MPSQAELHAKGASLDRFFCNGKRIFVRGVNWGMDEGDASRCEGFRCRARMEKEMNFNLIRNWSGDLDKAEFYEVCDELGIMVWEEFGISNGLMPDDPLCGCAAHATAYCGAETMLVSRCGARPTKPHPKIPS